jgi:hypothetical protein
MKKYALFLFLLVLAGCSEKVDPLSALGDRYEHRLSVKQSFTVSNDSPAVIKQPILRLSIPHGVKEKLEIVFDKNHSSDVVLKSHKKDTFEFVMQDLPPRSTELLEFSYYVFRNEYSLETAYKPLSLLESPERQSAVLRLPEAMDDTKPLALDAESLEMLEESNRFSKHYSEILSQAEAMASEKDVYLFYGFKCPKNGSCVLTEPVLWFESSIEKSDKLVVRNFTSIPEAKLFLNGVSEYAVSTAKISFKN